MKYVAETEREGICDREGRHRREGAVRSCVRGGEACRSDRAVHAEMPEEQGGLQGLPHQGLDEEVLHGRDEGRDLRAVHGSGRQVLGGRQEGLDGVRGCEGGQGCDGVVYKWREPII